jgi:hypothetical protein
MLAEAAGLERLELETGHADKTERERGSGGVDGTRTRGLRRDRPAF